MTRPAPSSKTTSTSAGNELAPAWRRTLAKVLEPQEDLPGRILYIILAALVGISNLGLNALTDGPLRWGDWSLMVAALVLVTLMPLRPVAASLGYLACWAVAVSLPWFYSTDLVLTNLVFFLLVGRLFTFRRAVALVVPFLALAAAAMLLQGLSSGTELALMAYLSMAVILTPIGSIARSIDEAHQRASERAAAAAKRMRLDIAREMHDLVAYSMSQTALRAQRASLDEHYPQVARQEFAALESTATDALHELRLLLRTLRQATPDLGQPIGTTTGLGGVVTDLASAVQAVSDDVSAAGFDVTYRCIGNAMPRRLQASTVSRVAREMGANIIRHGDPRLPVTITLNLGPQVTRLVSTNGIREASNPLPRSGTGIMGMRERLEAVDGNLTTLADDGAWITAATVPNSTPTTNTSVSP
ncbi:Sensor histidine kinase desK [Actinomyces bovis]|uniref:histidine kinase n=1 Tax=Actinomyces bovis TaxID=1658 RepID=A0ABY1VQW0_9ACTO|nr:Sensor histidine kinase desK [Actinomyces bovis]VEG55978.1 Sensor histidine kinase desK [Actinomyces israelii]